MIEFACIIVSSIVLMTAMVLGPFAIMESGAYILGVLEERRIKRCPSCEEDVSHRTMHGSICWKCHGSIHKK